LPAALARLQSEIKCGSLFHRSLSPRFAAMALYDPADGREPDPIAGKFHRGMQPLKRLEQTIGRSRIETASVVADEIHFSPTAIFLAEFNASVLMMRRVLPRVAQQILHDDAEKTHVSVCLHPQRSDEVHFPFGGLAAQLLHNRACKRAKVDLLAMHGAGCDSR